MVPGTVSPLTAAVTAFIQAAMLALAATSSPSRAARIDDPLTANTGVGARAFDDRGAYEYRRPPLIEKAFGEPRFVPYVLADRTCKLSPDGWGKRVVAAYHEFNADRIVAERNFGGAMVEHVIRTVEPRAAYREVTASRGKIARAEPVAALYEQSKVKHVGGFSELEDQMCALTPDGFLGDGSPDRADALVWAITELMLNKQAPVAASGTFVRR